VVAKVINDATAARVELSDLAEVIGRDGVLTARVLQAANSASYSAKRGSSVTLGDAVRIIGCSAVGNIAASVGIFQAMPAAEADGFNPILCWQHSLAVAMICNHLAGVETLGHAYLAGLCHNLGEVLFRSHFGPEYRKVLAAELTTGKPRPEVEREMLGITRGELVQKILKKLDLPSVIQDPIVEYHRVNRLHVEAVEPMVRMLELADVYATAMMRVSPDQAILRPIVQASYRAATGRDNVKPINAANLRGEVLRVTATFGDLSAEERAALTRVPGARAVRIWLARDPSLAIFDPLETALAGLCEVTVQNRLPNPVEAAECKAVIVAARHPMVAGFTVREITSFCVKPDGMRIPVRWFVGRTSDAAASQAGQVSPIPWPISLRALADFVAQL
jgi:HD-like signal output (HDOD) protein